MFKKISIMACVALTVCAPLTAFADARDDVDDLRTTNKKCS